MSSKKIKYPEPWGDDEKFDRIFSDGSKHVDTTARAGFFSEHTPQIIT